ncbi:MAG TPA: hydrogenase formation protein HypD, partial [Candidatus Krumholzibacteria bacterium]|nr:hydrogenase formation protein HypD [Candidatus Krumholzibacteria bacterium]
MRSPPQIAASIEAAMQGQPALSFMEICGTHTVSLFRSGVKSLLPASLRMVSGPGCPVCVTPVGYLDAACELALREGVSVLSYGDMMRVPGTSLSLAEARAMGARVEVVYSARSAVRYAKEHPEQEVVFLALGFETTTPASALAVLEARAAKLKNFSLLVGHKRVLPAMHALLQDESIPLDGFLCPGHVSVVIGTRVYEAITSVYGKACVVAGFEAESMLRAIERLVAMALSRHSAVENCYTVAVRPEGNCLALELIDRVFEPSDTTWRALGVLPDSGLRLRDAYADYDAARRYGLSLEADSHPPGCRCGDVICGKITPDACPLFRVACTPLAPVGPCMVSSEGSCAAWFKYAGAAVREASARTVREGPALAMPAPADPARSERR